MHKDFYASGFLYHPASGQILLQTLPLSASTEWLLLGAIGISTAVASEIFQNAIYESFQIKLALKKIIPVYSYFNNATGTNNHIFYGVVNNKKDVVAPDGKTVAWFKPSQITKLPTAKQTSHDLVVAQRVISAKERKRLGEHTFE